jgi:hypothetical protein
MVAFSFKYFDNILLYNLWTEFLTVEGKLLKTLDVLSWKVPDTIMALSMLSLLKTLAIFLEYKYLV